MPTDDEICFEAAARAPLFFVRPLLKVGRCSEQVIQYSIWAIYCMPRDSREDRISFLGSITCFPV